MKSSTYFETNVYQTIMLLKYVKWLFDIWIYCFSKKLSCFPGRSKTIVLARNKPIVLIRWPTVPDRQKNWMLACGWERVRFGSFFVVGLETIYWNSPNCTLKTHQTAHRFNTIKPVDKFINYVGQNYTDSKKKR